MDLHLPHDQNYVLGLRVGDPEELRLERGDITKFPCDAIVNAANSELAAGGGVCGAIFRAAGPALAEDCRRIRAEHGRVAPGDAVASVAGRLPASYVIHTVGPVWRGGRHGEAEVLESCHRKSMRIADDLGLDSIAFPAISTGIFGYPVENAAWVAIPTLIECLRAAKNLVLVWLVLFDKAALDVFAEVAGAQRQAGVAYEIWIGATHE